MGPSLWPSACRYPYRDPRSSRVWRCLNGTDFLRVTHTLRGSVTRKGKEGPGILVGRMLLVLSPMERGSVAYQETAIAYPDIE